MIKDNKTNKFQGFNVLASNHKMKQTSENKHTIPLHALNGHSFINQNKKQDR